jgi:hypothetical protein
MRRLVTTGTEEFENRVKSVDPVPLIEYEFWVKPKMGQLLCTNLGGEMDPGMETLSPISDQKAMQGWRYQGTNLPGNHVTLLKIELRPFT